MPTHYNKSQELIEFDVDEAICFIIDNTKSCAMRALRLYQLQIAILYCCPPRLKRNADSKKRAGPKPRQVDGFVLWVPRRFFDTITIYAASCILECIEDEHAEYTLDSEVFYNIIDDKNYKKMFYYFIKQRGWAWLRNSEGSALIHRDIKAKIKQASETAKLIAFSVRFNAFSNGSKKFGGVTSARDVLAGLRDTPYDSPECKPYAPLVATSTLKIYWKNHQYAPGLIYLAYFESINALAPPRLSKPGFYPYLMGILSDRDALSSAFGRHNAIVAALRTRGYSMQTIAVPGIPDIQIKDFGSLPSEIISLAK